MNDERVALRGGALELRPDCMHEARRPVSAAMSPLNDPQVVVSSTLTDPTWQNTNVLSGDVVEAVSKLKGETDGVILVAGSGALVATLLAADLVDELRLMVFPTILGHGSRLFPEGIERRKLQLAESRTVGLDEMLDSPAGHGGAPGLRVKR